MTEIEGVGGACIWEVGRDGRRLRLRAACGDASIGAERASAARDSHAGAALDSQLHVIVDDWSAERRFSMPPALRVLGVRSSLAVPIDGKQPPFGVLDIHSTEPNRFTPQDVHFVQASANVLADAIERHIADQALRHRVLHDPLTGLPNRLSFVDSLGDALQRSTASGSPVGILFLDLDNFKLINDSMGHHAGDELLRAVAPRLRAHLRPGDIVARFGGDEFGILVDRLADEDEAVAIADRIAAAFAEPYAMGGVEHFVSASVGIAVARPSTREPMDADLLIRDADAAMYRAKERGRARCELFDAEMRARALRRLEVERELRHALERDELELHYQPLIALRSGEITGLEALVRWRHPRARPARPRRVRLDRRGQRPDRADRPLGAGKRLPPDPRVAPAAARPAALRRLGQPLGPPGDPPRPRRLDRRDPRRAPASTRCTCGWRSPRASWSRSRRPRPRPLEALSEIGVGLVLDDFGTGYSSLAYLNRFPFDALKIDRSFVDALGVEQERTAIVEAIIGMARALSLDVIAEGVENEAQLSELRRLGCDYAQGHLFSRPLPAEKISALLSEGVRSIRGYRPAGRRR